MEAVVQLFAEKVIRAGIIDADRASQIRRVCSDTSDIIEFGEALLKDCPDRLDQVQGLLDQTVDEYQQGGRATRNPFEATAMSSTPRATLPVKFNRTAASRIPVPESETPGEPVRSTRPEAASQDRPVAQEPEAPRGQPVTEPDRIPVEQPSARGSAAQEEKAPAQAAAPVSEQASGTPRDRRNRPPEAVVSAEGIEPGIPDFESLDPRNNEQIATALIGMLLKLGESDFSDLHLSGGSRPFGRKFGEVEYLAGQPIGEDLARAFGMALLSPDQIAYFADFQDYDFAIALDNGRRYRTNLMQHRDGLKITFRLVPAKVPSLEALGFGQHIETIKNLLAYHNGLILVTGPVGCGKTTTLAAMVDELNRTRTDHIICVEDPIEIVHRSDQCSVTQRAVGPHTKSFKSALKGALRQDPDIIVIGEMRDLETIEMAISAPVLPAETEAFARPSFTASSALHMDDPLPRRRAWLGFMSLVILWSQ